MRISLLMPMAFAAAGAVWMNMDEAPQIKFYKQIAKSRDRESLANQLSEIGRSNPRDFEVFRTRQILISAGIGFFATVILISLRNSPILSIILALFLSTLTFAAIDFDLGKRVKKQRLMVDAEFPAVIEMYSLALSAGESPMMAMERIATSAHGSLAKEFSLVVAKVKSGKSFHFALDEMGRNLESMLVRKFVDSMIIATLRGAPLTDVLQRHAQEAREAQRNQMMGAAAKAEISMMVPIVFLILPISILFTLWPSLANLDLIAGA